MDPIHRRVVLKSASLSVLVALPPWVVAHLGSADFPSHIYNAWLADQLDKGTLEGVAFTPHSTNILFDRFLMVLLRLASPQVAEKIALSAIAVLLFWACLCFYRAVAGRWTWWLAPYAGMAAYGVIFLMGLDNFYVGTAFSILAIAALWNPSPRRVLIGAAAFALAWLAHPMPVVWTAAMLGYVWLWRRCDARGQRMLLAVTVCVIYVTARGLRKWAHGEFPTFQPFLRIAGTGELARHGLFFATLALLTLALAWGSILRRIRSEGTAAMFDDCVFNLYLLAAAAAWWMPYAFHFSHHLAGALLDMRFAFFCTIMLGAAASRCEPARWQKIALIVIAVVFAVFLWQDGRYISRVDESLRAAVERAPRGARVIARVPSGVPEPEQKVMSWIAARPMADLWYRHVTHGGVINAVHFIDGACVARCYSYADYELTVGEFQLRAVPGSKIALWDSRDTQAVDAGLYRVLPRDEPLYQVYPCSDQPGSFRVREMRVGQSVGEFTASEQVCGRSP